jgi:putative oxidoreductase
MKKQQYALFRILTSTIFLYAGIGHVFNAGKILAKLSATQFYSMMPEKSIITFLIYLSGLVMVAAGLMLAAGWKEKKAAAALLIVLIPITISVQLDNFKDLGPFFKNVAIAGSLLFIINYKQNENKDSVISYTNPVI